MESTDILIDDRSGRKINIPVGMIGFSAGNKLKEYLEADSEDLREYVWATVAFNLVIY